MNGTTSDSSETTCSKCLEQKRLNANRIELHLLHIKGDDGVDSMKAIKQEYQKTFQYLLVKLEATLKEKDDKIRCSLFVEFASFIEFIQDIFSKEQTVKLDENSSGSLQRLIEKLKSYQETDFNNNNNNNTRASITCSEAVYKTNLRLMEKEIAMLKDKLKKTQTELDKFKLKFRPSSTTQTNDSFWMDSNTNSSFFISNSKSTSPTLMNFNNQSYSAVSSLLTSNETGVGTGSCASGKPNFTHLDYDFDLLSNLNVEKLRFKINEQTRLLNELIKTLNGTVEEKLDSEVALSLPSFVKPEKLFKCPKCDTTIETCILTQSQIDHHLKHCNNNKLVCIFCLKLYDKTGDEQIDYETHLQKHVTQLFLTKSSPVVTTTSYASEKTNEEHLCLDESACKNKSESVLIVKSSQIVEEKYNGTNGEYCESGVAQKKSEKDINNVLTFSKAEAKPRKRL